MKSICLALTAISFAFAPDVFAQEAKFHSKLVTSATSGHAIDIDVDVTGAKELYLVVLDGGDSNVTDWADWAEPRLIVSGREVKLTDLTWKSATSGWGKVLVNQNAGGGALKIAGKEVHYGIGTHSQSVIAYELPTGVTRFKARGGLDNGGTDQSKLASVQFLVFTSMPSETTLTRLSGDINQIREPKNAVAGLDVGEGLEATLFASEASGLLSPSDIDIDHRGRVWVCEVVNYRHRNGERKEGDRILIVEDTNGDGISDKQTVFFQGKEVDSAMGICVLPTASGKGTKVVVSCSPNVWVFTDDDGDLKADRKELLFTNVGQPQHDHSAHAFIFGPDGKFYWNFGNTGHQVFDKNGKPIVDLLGHEVNDKGKPYRQGMAFRCNIDGSEFEVLGHNFRNNYELTVDSFGTVWQSDNDDDGNQGVRINYVMEGGNFGYTDEMTGAGWRTPRTNLESTIPQQHWHLNDPGVVPNLILTGAGSPTGICLYEGELLPERFRNQIIHTDAGPNVVRAYPAKKVGAGYAAKTDSILVGTRDNWFRPSDVCVAPDGSLIVADWYDPGVGGHRMGDVSKGRLFRVAPPKAAYQNPVYDVSTVAGAIDALKSPNLAARYLGWTTLHSQLNLPDSEAVSALTKVLQSEANPRIRARALGILSTHAKLKRKAIEIAVNDKDPDLRIAGLRLARQRRPGEDPAIYENDLSTLLKKLVEDFRPEVRRECALALRYLNGPKKAELWGALAVQHDGSDRWYLEALGIGAGNEWDACLTAALNAADNPSDEELAGSAIARDVFWRSRAKSSPRLLAMLLASGEVSVDDAPRYLRAFDFLSGPEKETALTRLAFGQTRDAAKTAYVNVEAISRLSAFDLMEHPEHFDAMNRILDRLKGQTQFVSLVDKFNVTSRFPQLLEMALASPDQQLGIDAARVLLVKKQDSILKSAIADKSGKSAIAAATALSNSGAADAADLLLPVALDSQRPSDLRREAIKGAARSKKGIQELKALAESGRFEDSLAPALSAALHGSASEEIRAAAEKLFPLPAGKDLKSLPPLNDLARLKGNSGSGEKLFNTIGKCNTCHVVNGNGKEVGPNLSEIGAKLSRQAFFESIIFPSAGISHNYESWNLSLKNGTTQSGIITSEDADSVTIKGADAISRKVSVNEIEERSKQSISLMPADLAKILSVEELADVVEYLTTLKQSKK